MALLLEDEATGIRSGSICFLPNSQWEMPATDPEQTGTWQPDRVGPVTVEWQAVRPRARGTELAYPLMLAAMRAIVRKTRRMPPFVVIVDLSTPSSAYIEVARIGDEGVNRLPALYSRSAGGLARAVELLTTDDSEPIFYLGNRPFPLGDNSQIGSLVLPLANHPGTLDALLALGTNRQTALRLVLLTAGQLTLVLALAGLGLWSWSAFQWLQIQAALDRYGPGLLQPELLPLKTQLRSAKSEHDGQFRLFADARKKHIPSTLLAGLLRRNSGTGTHIERMKLSGREKLELTMAGTPLAVLQSLGKFESLGKLGDLNFAARESEVSLPIEIELSPRSERRFGGKHS